MSLCVSHPEKQFLLFGFFYFKAFIVFVRDYLKSPSPEPYNIMKRTSGIYKLDIYIYKINKIVSILFSLTFVLVLFFSFRFIPLCSGGCSLFCFAYVPPWRALKFRFSCTTHTLQSHLTSNNTKLLEEVLLSRFGLKGF